MAKQFGPSDTWSSLTASCFYFLRKTAVFLLLDFRRHVNQNVFLCHCFSSRFHLLPSTQTTRGRKDSLRKKEKKNDRQEDRQRRQELQGRKRPTCIPYERPCLTRTLCQRVVKSYKRKRGGFQIHIEKKKKGEGVVNFSSSTFFFLWFRTARGSQPKKLSG